MRHLIAAVCAVLVVPLAACSSVDKSGVASRGFYSPDFDTVWEVSEKAIQDEGYAPDREASSKETKTLVSRWAMSLHPFYGRGYREQATIVFHENPQAENRWSAEVNVLREVNSEMKQPTNPVLANWEDGVRVPEKEALIVHRLEMFFRPHDVSPEFRALHGMPPKSRQPEAEVEKKAPAEPDDWIQHTR